MHCRPTKRACVQLPIHAFRKRICGSKKIAETPFWRWISNCHIDKALNWSSIKPEDSEAVKAWITQPKWKRFSTRTESCLSLKETPTTTKTCYIFVPVTSNMKSKMKEWFCHQCITSTSNNLRTWWLIAIKLMHVLPRKTQSIFRFLNNPTKRNFECL